MEMDGGPAGVTGRINSDCHFEEKLHHDPHASPWGCAGRSQGNVLANQGLIGVTRGIDLDDYDMAKKRRIEEKTEKKKRKSGEPNQERIMIARSTRESQGQVNKDTDVDLVDDSRWEVIKD